MEENEGVKPEEESPEPQEIVEEAPVDQEQQPDVTPFSDQQDKADVDGMGVPWKNRAMEAQRKLDKFEQQQTEIIETLKTVKSGDKREYSVEELETFASQTEDPAHKSWANREIRKLEKKELAEVVSKEISGWKQQQQADQVRQQTLNEVMQRHPDAFAKDQAGRTVGWNNNNALTQRIGQYMNDPEIAKNPRGLKVAAALAYADLSQGQTMTTRKKEEKLKTEVKNLQKQTLVEGGGQPTPPPKTPLQTALDQTQSGSLKDATAAMKELMMARGRLSEE